MAKLPGQCRNISTNYVNGNHPITSIKVLLRSVTLPLSPQGSQWTSIRRNRPPFELRTYLSLLLKNANVVSRRSCAIDVDNPGITPRIVLVKPLSPRQRKLRAKTKKEKLGRKWSRSLGKKKRLARKKKSSPQRKRKSRKPRLHQKPLLLVNPRNPRPHRTLIMRTTLHRIKPPGPLLFILSPTSLLSNITASQNPSLRSLFKGFTPRYVAANRSMLSQ